jgi:hypothetical protein
MKLLFDTDVALDSWGTEITDFCKTALMAGEYGATEESVVDWNLGIRHLMRSLTTTFWLLAMKNKTLIKRRKQKQQTCMNSVRMCWIRFRASRLSQYRRKWSLTTST